MNSDNRCPVTGKPCVKHKGYLVTEKKGDEVKSYSVCEDCIYINRGLKMQSGMDPCPICSTTIEDIIKTSRIGCAKCYEHFESPLSSIVASVQAGASTHNGTPPEFYKRRESESIRAVTFATEIMSKMKTAAREEKYEEASALKSILERVKSLMTRSDEKGEFGPEDRTELSRIIYRYKYPESLEGI